MGKNKKDKNSKIVYLFFKRVFDIIFGMIGLLILIPLSIIIKVIFLCNGDTGRIFYSQKRIGKDGKTIKILKYRSMVQNAEELLAEILKEEKYRKEWEYHQKIEDDPRITPIGNILRKTSLDELPQMLNVLAGNMSIVGPRPLVEGELEMHGGSKLYWEAKPGITGWWASHGRSDIRYKERLEMEYYYIENCSLKLDAICVYKTIMAVLKRQGAK